MHVHGLTIAIASGFVVVFVLASAPRRDGVAYNGVRPRVFQCCGSMPQGETVSQRTRCKAASRRDSAASHRRRLFPARRRALRTQRCSRERCAHEQRRSTDLRWAAPAAADCRGGSARATRRKKDGQRQKCVDEQSPRQLATVHGSSNDRASRPPRTANTILPSARGGSPASSVHARKPGLAAMRMHGRGNPSALKLACGWTRGQPEHRLANAQLYTQHSTGYSCACVSAQASPRVSPLLQRRTSR